MGRAGDVTTLFGLVADTLPVFSHLAVYDAAGPDPAHLRLRLMGNDFLIGINRRGLFPEALVSRTGFFTLALVRHARRNDSDFAVGSMRPAALRSARPRADPYRSSRPARFPAQKWEMTNARGAGVQANWTSVPASAASQAAALPPPAQPPPPAAGPRGGSAAVSDAAALASAVSDGVATIALTSDISLRQLNRSLLVRWPLSIRGACPGGRCVLDAAYRIPHFEVAPGASLSLSSLSLVNGRSSGMGGSMLVVAAALEATDCAFADSSSLSDGGAIAALAASNVTLARCAISNATAALGAGGAVSALHGSTVRMDGGSITGCVARAGAAVSAAFESRLEMAGVAVTGCRNPLDGTGA